MPTSKCKALKDEALEVLQLHYLNEGMTQECVDDMCCPTLITGGRMTKTSINAVSPDANNAHRETITSSGVAGKQPPTPNPQPQPQTSSTTLHSPPILLIHARLVIVNLIFIPHFTMACFFVCFFPTRTFLKF